MKESDVHVLTVKEHKDYHHICGRTGREVDITHACDNCPKDRWIACAMSHVEKGVDDEGVLGMIRTGCTFDDLKKIYEGVWQIKQLTKRNPLLKRGFSS